METLLKHILYDDENDNLFEVGDYVDIEYCISGGVVKRKESYVSAIDRNTIVISDSDENVSTLINIKNITKIAYSPKCYKF